MLESLEERRLMAYDLQILHASDMEAGLAAIADAPRFAAIVDAFDHTYANTLILSAGDNFLPGPFFNAGGDPALASLLGFASIGRADIEILNRIGVEASAIGNHEFDAGTRELANAFFPAGAWQGGQFPYLSANVNYAFEPDLSGRLSAGGQEASTIKGRIAPSAIVTEGGEKIGLIGLTTPEILTISSPGPNLQVTPASGQYDLVALAQVVNNSVAALQAQGVNKIVLLSHLQQFQNEINLAPMLSGVDIVIAAGSNTISKDAGDRLRADDVGRPTVDYPQVLTTADNTPVLVVSTDGNYRYVGRMVVQFDSNGVLVETAPGVFMNPAVSGAYAADDQGVIDVTGATTVADAIAASPKATSVKQITDAIASVIAAKDGNLFGKTSVYLDGRRAIVRTQETSLGNLTADANLYAARELTGDATIGISLKNGGGIRDSIGSSGLLGELLPPAANPAAGKQQGDISQLDIENSLRFNNSLSVVSVNGQELRRLLEHGFAASGPGQTQGRFPQIGGMEVEVDLSKPAGSRIVRLIATDVTGTSVSVVENGTTVAPASAFRMATLGFLVGNLVTPGGDGYPFQTLSNPQRVDVNTVARPAGIPTTFAGSGSEQDALALYLRANYSVTPYGEAETLAGDDARIQQVLTPSDGITLSRLSTVSVPGGAEISAYDKTTQRLFVTKNDGSTPSLDVINLANPSAPSVVTNIDLSSFGASISSVAVKDGLVVAAMIAAPKTSPGKAVFLDAATGDVLGHVVIGAVPDMITFTPDGNRVLVAIEGEAADNAFPTVNNPEGGVSIINLDRDDFSASQVTFAGFSQFNDQKAALRAAGVRLLTDPNVTVAMDLEPEYIAIAPDGLSARVTLQEANAFGVLDLVTNTFTSIQPLGLKDHRLAGNEFDASDRDGAGTGGSSLPLAGNLKNWPVYGVYMPDAVASFTVNGQTFYITANEGDARPNAADTADTDVTRVGGIAAANFDPAVFDAATVSLLRNEDNTGRLNILTGPGDSDSDGDGKIDRLLALGGRSFTIWDSAGNKVYDSGSDLERITLAQTPSFFNSQYSVNATTGAITFTLDGRSDDKGPEPEGVVTGVVAGRTYAFVGLERSGGGVMVYDVSDPAAPRFVQYIRTDGDVAPEGLVFIPAEDSPNGSALLVVSNEASGTVTTYNIARPPVLNEFVAGPSGYVEVLADPSTDLSAFTLLHVNGGGVISQVSPLTATDADGLLSLAANVATGSGTFLIVRGFTGAVGTDLDTNNDGVLDALPWAAQGLRDIVAVAGNTGRTYGTVALDAEFAAGASRIPNGIDTNDVSDWVANNSDGVALTGEAASTPGTANRLIFAPTITSFVTSAPSIGALGAGQTVTVSGAFVDPDAIGPYAVVIHWGDGSSSAAVVDSVDGTFTASKVYSVGGAYTATAILTDGDLAADDATADAIISGIGLQDGVLYIVGTSAGDKVTINPQGNGLLKVHADFLPKGKNFETFPLSQISYVLALLGEGADHLNVAGNVNLPLVVDGGAGNDKINGGAGRSVLIGGSGADDINGGSGENLLIGGTTSFDGQAMALLSILHEWSSNTDYLTRVQNLRTGAGSILDGTGIRLQVTGAGRTAVDDRSSDKLIGGASRDWFFADLDRNDRDDDKVDQKSNELIDFIFE